MAALVDCAGVDGAVYDLRIALPSIEEATFRQEMERDLGALRSEARRMRDEVDTHVGEQIAPGTGRADGGARRGRMGLSREHSSSPASNSTRWTRIALWLVGATMAYNVIEAVVALWSGAVADSIALLGFGLDSIIETGAAAALLWRLWVEARGADAEAMERTERRVLRFVGVTFLVLALYVTVQAGWTLWAADRPHESVVGIVMAAASLVIMPAVSWGKLRAATELGSAALRAEAHETLACSYLSFALLLGLVANAVAGWWWADPAAALLMVPWLVKEGREGLLGEDDDD